MKVNIVHTAAQKWIWKKYNMNITELHNKLLEFRLESGQQDLRADFNFESLFEPPDCSFCGNGTIPVLAIIHPEIPAKYCPMCGRKLGEKE